MSNRLRVYLISALCAFNHLAGAQSSFLYKCKSDFASDILEDQKGCVIAILENRIIRINPYGRLLWESYGKLLMSGIQIPDSPCIAYSAASTDMGGFAFKGYDLRGVLQWEKSILPIPEARLIRDFIFDSERGQYIVAGLKYFVGGFPKAQYWIAGVDNRGNILWENYWADSADTRYFRYIFKNPNTHGYVLSSNDDDATRRHEIFNVDTLGKVLQRAPIEPLPGAGFNGYSNYELASLIKWNDTCLLGIVHDDSKAQDFLYVYNLQLTPTKRVSGSGECLAATGDGGFIIGGGNEIRKYNRELKKEWTREAYTINKDSEAIKIAKIIQSANGGYYGVAHGPRWTGDPGNPEEFVVYVFKTDSMGRVTNTSESFEMNQVVMLQPNPARGKVRVAIPYYLGAIESSVYDVQGRLLRTILHNETGLIDIDFLKSGTYIVQSRVMETGEMRRMKLIVE